jgi:hypothetical protein
LKVKLNSISHRAQEVLSNPSFHKAGLLSDFLVTVDGDDKILTVFHGKKAEDVHFIIAEVLAKFSENKKILDIWKINFREIESFLRDENHLPAFTENIPELEQGLNFNKISLVGSAIKAKLGPEADVLFSQRKNWNQLSLAAKNQWAQKLLAPLGWELILCEEEVLTVTSMPESLDEAGSSQLINTILSGEESLPPMKVVAV